MDIHVLQSQPAQKVAFKDSSTVRVDLVRGGFQPRLPTSLPPPGQQQQPSPLPRRQPVPLMPPTQLHPGAPQVVAPAPAVPLQSPPPSELMDVDPSAGPPSQAVAVQPVLQPLSLGTPKESDTAAPCPAPTQQPSTQRQETLPLFVGPDAPSRPVPEAAPVVTGLSLAGEEKRKKGNSNAKREKERNKVDESMIENIANRKKEKKKLEESMMENINKIMGDIAKIKKISSESKVAAKGAKKEAR
ncbi:proline-rich protein 2-like [Schistocerca americana]|uniref:proline-rich protein 2-like n=1 Tax=Schistocerca americana TaxID=7009 RepID=UPI001F4FEC18|nr:proline-rich protein 2-like [Schistocerca americana]